MSRRKGLGFFDVIEAAAGRVGRQLAPKAVNVLADAALQLVENEIGRTVAGVQQRATAKRARVRAAAAVGAAGCGCDGPETTTGTVDGVPVVVIVERPPEGPRRR